MAHSELICSECHIESEIGDFYQDLPEDTDREPACPNCGNGSFGL